MTRCDEFYEKVERDGNFCGMREDHYTELLAYIELIRENPQIGGIAEGAVKPLIHEKDPLVKAKAIETLGKQIEHGNIATAGQVRQILDNIRARTPTKGGDHQGAVKPKESKQKDLSGIPTPEAVRELQEKIRAEKDQKEQERIDAVYEYRREEGDKDKVEDKTEMPDVEEDHIGSAPEMPDVEIPVATPVSDENEDVEEDKEKRIEDEKKAEVDRFTAQKRMEEREAEEKAEKIVVDCLKSLIEEGYPKQKLTRLLENALREILIPDGGCAMPGGSITKGNAITSNLGGR